MVRYTSKEKYTSNWAPSINRRRSLFDGASSYASLYPTAGDKAAIVKQFLALLKPPSGDTSSTPRDADPMAVLIACSQNWRMERVDAEQNCDTAKTGHVLILSG